MKHWFVLILLWLAAGPCLAQAAAETKTPEAEKEAIAQAIHSCIGWAQTKDFDRLYRVIAADPSFLEVHPNGRVVKGIADFRRAEATWRDPAFKAVRYEIRDLQITLAQCGTVAWFFCILDDINEWRGAPANWENTRWTGVLEKRRDTWMIVQQHFSFATEAK